MKNEEFLLWLDVNIEILMAVNEVISSVTFINYRFDESLGLIHFNYRLLSTYSIQ